jgi:HSP20 family protein
MSRDQMLQLRATQEQRQLIDQAAAAEGISRSEFRYGKFRRVIPLPNRIQNTQVQAEYKDGILSLTLPKAEAEKNKVVKITVG